MTDLLRLLVLEPVRGELVREAGPAEVQMARKSFPQNPYIHKH